MTGIYLTKLAASGAEEKAFEAGAGGDAENAYKEEQRRWTRTKRSRRRRRSKLEDAHKEEQAVARSKAEV